MARLALAEKKLAFSSEATDLDYLSPAIAALSPRGQLPLLIDEDKKAVPGAGAIVEYLEELYPLENLLGSNAAQRVETRSLLDWLSGTMAREFTDKLYGERLLKRVRRKGAPESQAIRAGLAAAGEFLDWIGQQCDSRRWLAGDQLSLADLACAAQISVVDYLGDINWAAAHPGAKAWYMRVKSRPSFRPLLTDSFPGLPPAPHYKELDF